MIHLSIITLEKLKPIWPGAVDFIEKSEATLLCSTHGLSLRDKDGKGIYAPLLVRPNIIDEVLSSPDKPSSYQALAIREMLYGWLGKARNELLNGHPGEAPAPPLPSAEPKKPAWAAEAPNPADTWHIVCKNPATVPKVKLTFAYQLYQRVSGTSGDSVYFYIAGHPGLKMAARYKNLALSVRVEGAITAYTEALATAGFKLNADYASIHLKAPSNQMLARALGALMYSIGIEWNTPMPSLDALIEYSTKLGN